MHSDDPTAPVSRDRRPVVESRPVFSDPPVAVFDLLLGLDDPPRYPGRVLVAVRRTLPSDPAAADQALGHLEGLYARLPDDLDPVVVRDLGLPRALGTTLDLRVLAGELGAPVPTTPTGSQLLRLSALRLGAASVFDRAPGGRGSLGVDTLAADVPELVSAAWAMLLLGAPASALRLTVLALLADSSDLVPPDLVRTAHGLLRRRWSLVPPSAVVVVWKLLVT